MSHQRKQKAARRHMPHQIDLFAVEPQTPIWSALPMETQATLTGLITQLILDHADKIRMTGVGDDL